MALTATLIEANPYSFAYDLDEAAGAAAALTVNVIAALTARTPIILALAPAWASQAALRTWADRNLRVALYTRSTTPAGATTGGIVAVDFDIVGGVVANNFRIVFTGVKPAAGDAGEFRVRVSLDHTLFD